MRFRWVPGALVALGLAGCAGAEREAGRPKAADPDKTLRAVRLIRTWPVPAGGPVTPGQARRLTARLRRLLPLPAGGTFAGVRWEAGGPQPIPRAQLAGVLEVNAVCQWIRAQREGRERATAQAVLAAAAHWPPIRGVPVDEPAFVTSCYAAHDREVEWARRHERRPTT